YLKIIGTSGKPSIYEMYDPKRPTKMATDLGTGNEGLDFQILGFKGHHLGIDQRITFSPATTIHLPVPIKEADMVLVVHYRPWIIPIRMDGKFRFVARKDSAGNVYWRSWPTNEPPPTD
ncbi:MAG: hypothetical protein WCC14_07620, partial [Acidobacteriaceae bacterium]